MKCFFKSNYFQALIRGMQRFIGQNGILHVGSFSKFRGDHTYHIFEEVAPLGYEMDFVIKYKIKIARKTHELYELHRDYAIRKRSHQLV